MKFRPSLFTLFALAGIRAFTAAAPADPPSFQPEQLPVRALMLYGMPPSALDSLLEFVRVDLPAIGVNTLIFQIDYHYEYESRPEMIAAPAFTRSQVKSLVAACRESGIRLIPLLNCLGHQSWAENTHRLLTVHPEFDETPGLYPKNKDIYCRSYCINHPGVHAVIFDLLGEIVDVFETEAVHVGMDEVFLLGEDACPRCRGRDKAELFAQEVRTLRDFLAGKNARLWLWGDRLIDGRTTGLGEWEGSHNDTHRAIDLVPKDVVICDWHYEAAAPTPGLFALKGFEVIACSYNRPAVGAAQVEEMVRARRLNRGNPVLASRFLGVMATNWGQSEKFPAVLRTALATGEEAGAPAVENFVRVMKRVRELAAEAGARSDLPE